jgi:hypothetical protein
MHGLSNIVNDFVYGKTPSEIAVYIVNDLKYSDLP